MEAAGRAVLIVGLGLALLGLGLMLAGRLGLTWRPLPGDLVVRRPGLVVSLPLATMILVSIVLTLILNFVAWLRR